MKDEKEVTVSQNNNGKGNPYHEPAGSEKGGQFAPANKATSGQKVEAAAANNGGSGFDDFMSFMFASKGIDPNDAGQKEDPNTETPDMSEEELTEMAKDYGYDDEPDVVTFEEAEDNLKKFMAEQAADASKDYLMSMPFINEESVAKMSNYDAACVEDAYAKLAGEQAYINNAVEPYNKDACVGVWITKVYPSQYKEKLESGAIEKKYNFYNYDYKGDNKEEWIAKLDKFVEDGKAYEEALANAKSVFAGDHEIVDAFEKEHMLTQEQIMALDAYSAIRKKAAKIIDLGNIDKEVQATRAKHELHTKAWLKKCSMQEQNAMVGYTGSYCWLNEPLREINYLGYKPHFVETVNMITSAISKSVFDVDMTLKRGTDQVLVNNIDGTGLMINSYTSQEDLNKIIGTTFKDQAFVSCGGSEHAKKAGYPDPPPVRMNIYAPAGTEVGYFGPFSGFHGENEFVINRGYSYRITNAYKVGGNVVMDVEVILGSNSTAHSQEKLKELAGKHMTK